MARKPLKPPKLYFSFRSPYSWLTVRRLRAEVPNVLEAFDVMPYWDPDERTSRDLEQAGGEFHYAQMSRAKHLYILMDTKRLSQAEGVAMAWPIDVDPFWELPHLGWLRARAAGRADQFYDEVIAARWERGENICEPDVLSGCASRAGLDPASIVDAHLDDAVRKEGVDCLYQAYMDDIFAVPYLKWGPHRFWGLDRVGAFLTHWREGNETPAVQAPPHLEKAYDTDQAGGCG
jgi:2-hydroxychromene-2-carboxylate isomerase